MKLQHELSIAEEKLKKALSQGKLLEGDRKVLDTGIAKANNSIKVSWQHQIQSCWKSPALSGTALLCLEQPCSTCNSPALPATSCTLPSSKATSHT